MKFSVTLKRGMSDSESAVAIVEADTEEQAKDIALDQVDRDKLTWKLNNDFESETTAAAPHVQTLLLLLLGTGMRMAEALELDWRDVDLAGGRAILWPDQTTARKRRNVSLPPRVVAALANLQQREGAVIRRPDGLPYADRQREGAAKSRRHERRHCAGPGSIPRSYRMIAGIPGRAGTMPSTETCSRSKSPAAGHRPNCASAMRISCRLAKRRRSSSFISNLVASRPGRRS
jgi:integrase